MEGYLTRKLYVNDRPIKYYKNHIAMSGSCLTKEKKNTDTICPECGMKTFERGTLLVGGKPGGPLRFEYGPLKKSIKVRSRACRSCGYVSSRINPTHWENDRLSLIHSVVTEKCKEDDTFSLSFHEGNSKSGTVRISLSELKFDDSWHDEILGPLFDEMLEKYINEDRIIARMCVCKMTLAKGKKELVVKWRFSKKEYDKDEPD